MASKLRSIIENKCPKCRSGNMYKHSAFNLLKFSKMNSKCPVCGVGLKPEPGFYIGGMYISYAVNVAVIVAVFLFVKIVFEPNKLIIYIAAILVPTILLFPYNFRVSRTMMLHLFGGIKYDSSYQNKDL